MLAKIQNRGNCLTQRILKAFTLDAGLENSPAVEISHIDGQIIVKPVATQGWSLEQLLAGVTNDNLHREVDTGEALGNEAW